MVSQDRPSVSIIATMFRYRGWFLLPLVVIGAAAAVLAARLPDRYQADVLVLIRPMNFPEAFVRRADMSRIENQIQTLKEVLLSRTLLERVIAEFKLYGDLAGRATRDELLTRTRKDIKVQVRYDDVFALSYQAADPRTAAAVSNRLAELFVALLKAQVQQVDTSAARIEFLESRLRDLKVRLDDLLVTFTDGYPEVAAVRRQIHALERELSLARSAPGSAPAANAPAAAGSGNILFEPQEAQILDAAVPPEKPSGPPRPLIALAGVALGAGVGAGLALARGRLDRSFSEPHDVQDHTGIAVLAVIPRIHSAERRRRRTRMAVAVSATAATVALLLLYRYVAFPEVGMAQLFGLIR